MVSLNECVLAHPCFTTWRELYQVGHIEQFQCISLDKGFIVHESLYYKEKVSISIT